MCNERMGAAAGVGSRLPAAAEREAEARGCSQVVPGTHSFQAPDLYQRLGYEIVSSIDDYPTGHRKYHTQELAGRGPPPRRGIPVAYGLIGRIFSSSISSRSGMP
jgi:GNAT superfamily N-acetyltransferase